MRHYCVIDQSATENKVIHTLIIDFFSHGLRSVKIEQELEKGLYAILDLFICFHKNGFLRGRIIYFMRCDEKFPSSKTYQ
jgi:hypothetical protein